MARLMRIHSQIHVNRLIRANRFRVPELSPLCPKGPNLEKNQDLEIFKRAWNFQASHPPNPYFFCGEFWRSGLKISSEIEIFKRDWKFQAILIFFKIWALRVLRIALWGAKHMQVWAIGANPLNVVKIGCESPGHLSFWIAKRKSQSEKREEPQTPTYNGKIWANIWQTMAKIAKLNPEDTSLTN